MTVTNRETSVTVSPATSDEQPAPATDDSGPSETADQDPETCRVANAECARPSLAVVESVAALEEMPATALPSLHSVVDPDALDALVRGADGERRSPVSVSFTYEGYDITVRNE